MIPTVPDISSGRLLWQLVCRRWGGAYAAALLGPAWQLLQPALYVVILTLVLGHWVTFEEPGVAATGRARYGIFLCCGLLPWRSLAQAATGSASIFVSAAQFLRRTRVNPLVYLWAELANSTIQFVTVFAAFLVIAGFAGVTPRLAWIQLLPLVALQILLMLGIQLCSAPIGVFFRDLPHLYSVTFQVLFWATPIAYHARLLERAPKWLLSFNPLWHLVKSYRTVVLSDRWMTTHEWMVAGGIAGVALLVGSVIYYHLADDVPDFV
jgi:ABC-type polysaccharide/polyol phosphate export permease